MEVRVVHGDYGERSMGISGEIRRRKRRVGRVGKAMLSRGTARQNEKGRVCQEVVYDWSLE